MCSGIRIITGKTKASINSGIVDRTNLALSSAINSSVYVAVASWFRNRIKVNTKETFLEFFFFFFFGLSDLLLQIHNNVFKMLVKAQTRN